MRSYFVHLDRTTLIWLLINNVFSNNFRRLTFDLCYDYLKDIIIKLILALKLSHSPLYSVEMRASLHAHRGSAFQPLEMTYTPCGCRSSYKQRHMLKLTQGRQEAHTWPRALQQAALETEMWRGPEQVLPGLRGAETRMRNEDVATHNLVPPSRVAGGKVFSDNGYLDAFPSARQQQSVRGAQEEREERNRSPGALPEDAQHCRCSGGGALAGRGRSW